MRTLQIEALEDRRLMAVYQSLDGRGSYLGVDVEVSFTRGQSLVANLGIRRR